MNIAKEKEFGKPSKHGMAISPLLQSHYLSFCAEVVPATATRLMNSALGAKLTNNAQAFRLEEYYGNLPSVEKELQNPLVMRELQVSSQAKNIGLADEEHLYAMFDGGMLCYDNGYQEVKVGRVFRGSQVIEGQLDDETGNQRNRVLNSEYLVQEGHYSNFVTAFSKLLTAQQALYPLATLIIITDGATWMRNWIAQAFPQAVHILDFFHAFEHLCEFGKILKLQATDRQKKLANWKEQLRAGNVRQIILEVEMYLTNPNAEVSKAAAELLTYLTNNEDRMKYHEYRDKGYLIGSGAIESAVSTIVQQRCKLRGQRWNNGA